MKRTFQLICLLGGNPYLGELESFGWVSIIEIVKIIRFLSAVLLGFLFLISSSSNLFAQTSESLIFPSPDLNSSYFGQDHAYSVNLRGNGEAVITMRSIFSNNSDKPVSKITLRVPKVNPQDILVFQVLRDPVCIRYQTQIGVLDSRILPPCLEYQEPNYYDYYSYGAKYQKAKFDLSGDTIEITLPKEVKTASSGGYLLYYRAFGYANKNLFGSNDFEFETLKVNDKIGALSVGINTDSDYFLKGGKGKIDYRFGEAPSLLTSQNLDQEAKSVQIDSLYGQIGQGEIYKNVSDLAALESYSVKGSFSDSRIRLYGKELSIGLLILVVLVVVLLLILKLVFKSLKISGQSQNSLNVLIVLGTSFLSSLLILGYTILIFFLNNNFLSNLVSGQFFEFGGILVLLEIIISIFIYALIAVVPTILLGIKKGWLWGILSFISTGLFLGFYLVIFMFFLMFFREDNYIYPMPLSAPKSIQLEGDEGAFSEGTSE